MFRDQYGFDEDYSLQNRPQSDAQLRTKLRPESAKIRLPSAKLNKSGNGRPTSAQVPKLMKQQNKNYEDDQPQPIYEYEEEPFVFNNKMDFNNILVNPPQYPSQENKKLPRNIKKDKEKLYEEVLDMKSQLNQIREENTRLKTRNLALQKENTKLDQLLKNVQGQLQTGNQSHQFVQDHLLLNNFKKQLKELKGVLIDKEAELTQLKRNIKVTKLEEVEAELKNYIEESIRLRSLLDQALRNQAATKMVQDMTQVEEKFYIQMKVINSLQQEVDNFHSIVNLKEEEIFKLQVKQDQLNNELSGVSQQLMESRQAYENSQKRVEQLERDIHNIKNVNNELIINATKSHQDELTIRKLEMKQADHKKEINDRDRRIAELEKMIIDLKNTNNDQMAVYERERKNLEINMERYKTLYEQTDEKFKSNLYTNLKNTSAPATTHHDDNARQQEFRRESQSNNQNNTSQESRSQSLVKKRLRTVKYDDVKDIGLAMNLKFRIKRLKLENIINNDLMDPIIVNRGLISIRDIAVRLSNEPFQLTDVEQIYLVARYLVEDNTQEWVDYSEDRAQTVQIVRSIFTKLVGRCKIINVEEIPKLQDEIIGQVLKFRKSLQSYLPTLGSPLLSREQIQTAFQFIGVEISQDAYDYFFLRLYELSGEKNVTEYDYKLILDEWGKDEDKKRRQEKSKTNSMSGSKYNT